MYQGPSIVDYLASVGQASDYGSRAQLASSKGISGYVGSAQQNTQLLNMLRGSGATPPPAPPPGQTPQNNQAPAPTFSGGSPATSAGSGTPPPYAPDTVNQTVDYGGVTWKGNPGTGWTAQSQTGGGAVDGGTINFNQPTINLPEIYKSLYESSGIKTIEADLAAKTNAYNEQVAKIKDNPYLSEGNMTGRLSKLKDKFNADTALAQNNIAMKKADVETQLNLQTKQFDIESNQAKQAWDQFSTLLSAGALDNASGEDIASITRATGLSSSMIQSAIGISKEKNKPKLNTQVIQVDDGTNVNAVVINQDTGQVINTQVIGQSKPEKTAAGKGASATEIKAQEKSQNTANLMTEIKAKKTLRDLINYWGQVLSIDEIYRLYNSNSPYGKAKETLAEVKQGKFKS